MLSAFTRHWHKDLQLLHMYSDEEGGHDPVTALQRKWY
jgi:hypothetical protein